MPFVEIVQVGRKLGAHTSGFCACRTSRTWRRRPAESVRPTQQSVERPEQPHVFHQVVNARPQRFFLRRRFNDRLRGGRGTPWSRVCSNVPEHRLRRRRRPHCRCFVAFVGALVLGVHPQTLLRSSAVYRVPTSLRLDNPATYLAPYVCTPAQISAWLTLDRESHTSWTRSFTPESSSLPQPTVKTTRLAASTRVSTQHRNLFAGPPGTAKG